MEGEFEYISWKFRFEHYGQQLTTNCRVSFIDLYLIFSTNFKIVYLPPPTHTHSSKNLQKGKHHSAANKGDRREQKDGRRTHSKNNNNSNNLVPTKILKRKTKRVTNDFTNVPTGTPLTLKKEVPTTCVWWSWCFSFFLSLICVFYQVSWYRLFWKFLN